MNSRQALEQLVSTASAYAENAEESLPHRLTGNESDAELMDMLRGALPERREPQDFEFEDAQMVRDVWKAVDVANAIIQQKGCDCRDAQDAYDDRLTTLIDTIIFG